VVYARELLRLKDQGLAEVGNRVGMIGQIVVAVTSMQKSEIVLRIQRDRYCEGLEGGALGLQVFRLAVAVEGFLRLLPGKAGLSGRLRRLSHGWPGVLGLLSVTR
jgi:hypothetical protein